MNGNWNEDPETSDKVNVVEAAFSEAIFNYLRDNLRIELTKRSSYEGPAIKVALLLRSPKTGLYEEISSDRHSIL